MTHLVNLLPYEVTLTQKTVHLLHKMTLFMKRSCWILDMLFPVPYNYNKILILTHTDKFLKIIKICPKKVGSFNLCINGSGFLIFLNERNRSLEENMRFIQISNGCDLIFYLIMNVTLSQITVHLLHKMTLFNEAILLNFGYVVPSAL